VLRVPREDKELRDREELRVLRVPTKVLKEHQGVEDQQEHLVRMEDRELKELVALQVQDQRDQQVRQEQMEGQEDKVHRELKEHKVHHQIED
jgi:hypothetical protein